MNKNPLREITREICGHIRQPMDVREIAKELASGEYSAEFIMQHLLLYVDLIANKLQDPSQVHSMMLMGEIAWDPPRIRHLLGDDDLIDMLIRCEGWFSTLPEGRKMQLECQRVIALHIAKDTQITQ